MRNALIDSIRGLLKLERHRAALVVIDGPAGAGKTTLAEEIRKSVGEGEVIHCDDLYNGWDDALTPTLERHLLEWIVGPLSQGQLPIYQKYDWSTGRYGKQIHVPHTRLVILEGVGAALKCVTDIADISIWLEIPQSLGPAFGLTRVLERDGAQIETEMLRWIEQQKEFFKEHHNRDNCSIHLPYGAPAEQ